MSAFFQPFLPINLLRSIIFHFSILGKLKKTFFLANERRKKISFQFSHIPNFSGERVSDVRTKPAKAAVFSIPPPLIRFFAVKMSIIEDEEDERQRSKTKTAARYFIFAFNLLTFIGGFGLLFVGVALKTHYKLFFDFIDEALFDLSLSCIVLAVLVCLVSFLGNFLYLLRVVLVVVGEKFKIEARLTIKVEVT